MKKLLTLSVLLGSLILAGCVNTNPTEEEVAAPVAEEVVTPETPAVEVAPVAEETAPVAAEETTPAAEVAPAAEVTPEAPAAQ